MAFFRDVAKAAFAICLVLILFELGLRSTGTKYESSFYETDPVLYMALRPRAAGWEAKEGENFIHINSLGMRDKERTVTVAADTLRVAVLGDSMIAATEVPLEHTMSQLLEARLQTAMGPTPKVEVLNFGVGGYTLSQELLLLQNRIWAFRPDVVLLFLSPSSIPSCNRHVFQGNVPFFILNNGVLTADPHNRPPLSSSIAEQQWHGFFGDLMNRIRLLQMIRKATQDGIPQKVAVARGKKRSRNKNILDMWIYPPQSDAQHDAWSVAEAVLVEMHNQAHQHGAEFWLSATGPEIEENPNSAERNIFLENHRIDSFSYAEQRLESFAASHQIQFMPVEPQLLDYAQKHEISLRGFFNTRPNFGHWNEQGNAAAAEIISEYLLRDSPALQAAAHSSAAQIADTRHVR